MNDRELALNYLPAFYFDRNEPFPIRAIGYSIIRSSRRSPSFDRYLTVSADVEFIIEYAVYYDYDIQHLYDLEHAWVYVDREGRICDGESSAHGGFRNCFRYLQQTKEGTHLTLYSQPGKHALFPDGQLFRLYPDYESACGDRAGLAGLLITKLFEGKMETDDYVNYRVCDYIRKNYQFKVTLEFEHRHCEDSILMPMQELLDWIPVRIDGLLKDLGIR